MTRDGCSSVPPHSKNAVPRSTILGAVSWTLCVRSEPLVLQIADVIDADDVVACIADRFIASDVRLAQDVGLSEIAFALRNSRDGFTLWVENGAYRARPVILLNVRCHADRRVTQLTQVGFLDLIPKSLRTNQAHRSAAKSG